MKNNILIYVMHLLGNGHVYRIKYLVESLVAHGFGVAIIYGGKKLPITFTTNNICYLPAVSAKNAEYQKYIDENGKKITKAYLQRRQKLMQKFIAKNKFDMIITETFPFGRHIVSNELFALLEQARQQNPNAIIASSVRDIIEPHKDEKKYNKIKSIIKNYYDYIFVHGDKNIAKLNSKYQAGRKTIYTGFITSTASVASVDKNYDVIVSCGGGAFGFQLLQTAIELAKQQQWNKLTWALVAGVNMDAKQIAELKKLARATDNIKIVKPFLNLQRQLSRAKFSISQCGYNTAMDILLTKNCNKNFNSVFVPFDMVGQQEQLLRAKFLAKKKLAICLPHSQLTVGRLGRALLAAKKLTAKKMAFNFNGGNNCASIIKKLLRATR